VNRARVEVLLWLMTVVILLWGGVRWQHPDSPLVDEARPGYTSAPPGPMGVSIERLENASRSIAAHNPFRLDRSPAPPGFIQDDGGIRFGMTSYQPPRAARPILTVSGIAGPPWRAVLEGVPGREGGVVVQRGDELNDLRIRDVTATTLVVASPDTVWRLTLRKQWQ
jgi:hypothetical protein